jgi:CRP/FNR family transcriptional regulator, cyclic AMP receptor protein
MMGESLFVISEGKVKISAKSAQGREQVLLTLGPGDSLGEAAILRVGPRLCTATADTDLSVVEIARRDIIHLQKTRPQACIKLMMSVTEILGARARDTSPDLRKLLFPGGGR